MHVLKGNSETIFLGPDVGEHKALIVNIHDVFAQVCQLVKDSLTVLLDEAFPTHMYIAYRRPILPTSHYGHALE